MQARIKPDIPLPWILVMRFAAADREGASMHIPVVDVAAFLASLGPAPASFESLNHSATVNPKLREIHRLLGRQRVRGRDDLEVFGRRDGNPDFRAVLTPDCRPPATGLVLVSVDNVRLINDRHESCFSARSSPLGEFRLHIATM